MEKYLYILRAASGAGKTTFANSLGTKAICCADDYFMYNGKYMWNSASISKAHMWCQRKCLKFMAVNAERIVIANTNTTEKEFKSYIDMANVFGYKIFFLIIENRHGNKNIHNVPEETIENMRKRLFNSIKL